MIDLDAALDPQAAAALVLARRKARVTYADYLRYWITATKQNLQWNWHWEYLADIMQGVADRDSQLRFLIVNIPPRFAKSTILSQQWQAWMIGRENNRRSSLFSMSSSATLAGRDSRTTLDTIRAQWYRALFPHVATGTKEREDEWNTSGGAYRISCGREGTVTGRGGDHLLLDDLVAADEADSETVREQANEFLGRSMRSRLDDQKTGTITNIQQRLHENDATGFLLDLAHRGGDKYHLLSIPNEAPTRVTVEYRGKVYKHREAGELLHPERIGPDETKALRVAMRANYEGQYQQNPVKMEGAHLDPRRLLKLKGSGIELKSSLGLRPYFYMDFAATEKQISKNDPDFSVILVAARDQLDRLIILDIWRKQTPDYGMVARTLIAMHRLWRPVMVKGERGALLNLFQPILRQQMALMGHYLSLEPLPHRRTDKVERSMPFQGMLNAGMVAVPEQATWLPEFEREARAFPLGTHDDICDCASDAATDHSTMSKGEAPSYAPTDEGVLLNKLHHERYAQARADQIADRSGVRDTGPGSNWA